MKTEKKVIEEKFCVKADEEILQRYPFGVLLIELEFRQRVPNLLKQFETLFGYLHSGKYGDSLHPLRYFKDLKVLHVAQNIYHRFSGNVLMKYEWIGLHVTGLRKLEILKNIQKHLKTQVINSKRLQHLKQINISLCFDVSRIDYDMT